MIKLARLAVLAALAGAFLAAGAACGDDSNATPAEPTAAATQPAAYPLEIPRSDGKTLTLAEAPRHIVSLSPGATEILYAIGAEASVVAVDNQADYPKAAANFATKVDAYEPNLEAIAGLDPGLVIVANDNGGIVAALDRLRIPVFYVDLDTDVKTVEDVIAQVRLLGRVTDTSAAAERVAADLEARVKRVDDAIAAAPSTARLSVYHELDSTFYSVADQTFIGSLYARLRATNIAGDGGGTAYPQLTQEAIIAANPSVIVLADEEFGVTIDSVKARPGWDAIDAVANGRIYAIDPDIISRPGPRIVDALEQLARDLYPEAFE